MSRPLQNRIAPTGEIVATQERGTMFGNRGGQIHDKSMKIKKKWASKQWICCVLDFKNRQRTVMGDSYTELFFLDEATALAAGHRPCFECRRQDALMFSTLWAKLQGRSERAKVAEMDKTLHAERLGPYKTIEFKSVPIGTMVLHGTETYLKVPKGAKKWSFSGYLAPISISGQVEAITPKSIRDILTAGYKPQLHPTAILT